MKSRLNRLADLAPLRALLKRQEEEAAEALRLRLEAEAKARADAQLFHAAMAGVTPQKPSGRATAIRPQPPPIPRQRLADEQAALKQSMSDDFTAESLLETDDTLSWHRDGVGGDVVRKLRRGRWVIEDEIDLHGARTDEARELLGDFLKRSVKRGIRAVRVVHGKGLGSQGGQPVLKGKVRRWLVQRDEVLAFCQARAQDGGAGALLVLLRPVDRP